MFQNSKLKQIFSIGRTKGKKLYKNIFIIKLDELINT